ncbi:hypothetical protein GEMRC1_001078 [Eukaryota sp. GEM-RC1]
MPSVVAFSNGVITLGKAAEQLMDKEPRNVTREFKRLMGQSFHTVEKELFPRLSSITEMGNDGIGILLDGQTSSPEDLSSFILDRINNIARELQVVPNFPDTIISVPAYFTDRQKDATIVAGKRAELNVIGVLEDPIAVAITFFDSFPQLNVAGNIFLVFDLGGSTFDITLVGAGGDSHTVIDFDGDVNLGGSDFDELLLQFCLDSATTQFGDEIRNNLQFVSSLRIQVQKAKLLFSTNQKFRINLQLENCVFKNFFLVKNSSICVMRNSTVVWT